VYDPYVKFSDSPSALMNDAPDTVSGPKLLPASVIDVPPDVTNGAMFPVTVVTAGDAYDTAHAAVSAQTAPATLTKRRRHGRLLPADLHHHRVPAARAGRRRALHVRVVRHVAARQRLRLARRAAEPRRQHGSRRR
jgi:hypothetical protein